MSNKHNTSDRQSPKKSTSAWNIISRTPRLYWHPTRESCRSRRNCLVRSRERAYIAVDASQMFGQLCCTVPDVYFEKSVRHVSHDELNIWSVNSIVKTRKLYML